MARPRKDQSAPPSSDASASPWAALTWDDLDRWAGSRSVERGRSYQRGGRVRNLAITDDGRLLADVNGTERYVTSVSLASTGKRRSQLASQCTCPLQCDGCKHAVAVVAEYLAMLADGRRVIDQEWVQINLARVYAGLEFLRLINWKVAWTATKGSVSPADASATKVFGTEWYLESFRLLMEIMGQRGYLKRGSPEAVFDGQLEVLYRGLLILTFGGGTNEIQRDLIGLFGLGLPRVPRM